MTEQLADSKVQLTHLQSDITQLRTRLEETKREKKETDSQLEKVNSDMLKIQTETGKRDLEARKLIDELKAQISTRDNLIIRLKDDIKKKEEELDDQENDNSMRMKELQLSINSLLASRARKSRSPLRNFYMMNSHFCNLSFSNKQMFNFWYKTTYGCQTLEKRLTV
ncbi:hypothetical protein HK096_001598 [Nowakowskiella sp. JEL0078]|nr:hypothetical protein HK096_001598 [Nowakowskiella sp. JEL0078]